jgi:hypothetical protein
MACSGTALLRVLNESIRLAGEEFPTFMEPGDTLQCSQYGITGPYLEANKSSPAHT